MGRMHSGQTVGAQRCTDYSRFLRGQFGRVYVLKASAIIIQLFILVAACLIQPFIFIETTYQGLHT